MEMMFKSISIITAQGAKSYCIGHCLDSGVVSKIELVDMRDLGPDPITQYCGFDEHGKILFRVDPSCPHECEYI